MAGIYVLAACLLICIVCVALFQAFKFELFDAKYELVVGILKECLMDENLLTQVFLASRGCS